MDAKIAKVFAPFKNFIFEAKNFTKKTKIGSGGFSEVWHAQYTSNPSIDVAYKELKVDIFEERDLKLFQREIKILYRFFGNAFIIQLYGFSIKYPFFIATQYMENGSLFKILRSDSVILTPTNKTKIAIGIIEGMIYLHANGIVHRDLKSPNILLSREFLPKICDFGCSRAIKCNLALTGNVGTINWMAPEVNGGVYNFKADVYSFSLLLWEILTGEFPFENDKLQGLTLLLKIIQVDYRPKIPSNCNSKLAGIITQCWDKNQQVRPSFAELYEIFKDPEIWFDGTESEEIEQFYQKYPISEELLQKVRDNSNQKLTDAEQETIPEIVPQQPKPNEVPKHSLKKTSSNYDNQIDETEYADSNLCEFFESAALTKKERVRRQTSSTELSNQPQFPLRTDSIHSSEDFDKKRQSLNLNMIRIQEKIRNNESQSNLSFDEIYDLEMYQNPVPFSSEIGIEKNNIKHKTVRLEDNIFAQFFARRKLSRTVSGQILTENCDNIFLRQNSPSTVNNQSLQVFKLNPTVYKILDDQKFPSNNNVVISMTSQCSQTEGQSKIEFKFDEEEKEANTQIQQLYWSNQILIALQSELRDIQYDLAESFFHNIQLIISQTNSSQMTDMLVYFLARGIGSRHELIIPLNKSELFAVLPISKKPIVIASFIELFVICLLKDFDNFPIDIFRKVIQHTTTSRNTLQFIQMFQVLDNLISLDSSSSEFREDGITMDYLKANLIKQILKVFSIHRKQFFTYREFSLTFFNIYLKLQRICTSSKINQSMSQTNDEAIIDDHYCHCIRTELIIIALDSLQYSRKVDSTRAAYNIILSQDVNAIQLSEQNMFQLPLRSIVNQIQPKYMTDKVHEHTWCCGELLYESISVFVRLQSPPCSLTLIKNLFDHAILNLPHTTSQYVVSNNEDVEIAKMATMILCKIAKTKKGSQLLMKNCEWLDHAISLSKSDIQPTLIEPRLSFCLTIIITLYKSHCMLRDSLAKTPTFWHFLSSYINLAPSNLTQILRFVCLAVRRFSPSVMSTEEVISSINESQLLHTFSSAIFKDLHFHNEKNQSAEYAIEIVDLIARSTYNPSSSDASVHFRPFLCEISILLSFGGVIANKTIIASLSVFLLYPKALRALQKMNKKTRFENIDQIKLIRDSLKKLTVCKSIKKYKDTLMAFLSKARNNQ